MQAITISFSGLDGSGKTTQINLAREYLEKLGHRVTVIRMYDNVSVSAFLRKRLWKPLGRRAKSRPAGEAAGPKPPGYRKDKNRKGTAIVLLRQLVYPIDLLVFSAVAFYHHTLRRKTMICDRHLIDSIVNLSNTNRLAEAYAGLLLRIIPLADYPILLDVDARVAFERKPEYPLTYNVERRQAYLDAFRRLRRGFVVGVAEIPSTHAKIRSILDGEEQKQR